MSFLSKLFGQRSSSVPSSDATIQNTPKSSEPQPWNFRNIKDINNIVPYATLHLRENQMFLSYLFNNFQDCKLETKVQATQLFPHAPVYAMPINFLLTKGDKKVAILLVGGGKEYQRYSVLETMELCKENNIIPLRFITTFPNHEKYVVQRIAKYLNQEEVC